MSELSITKEEFYSLFPGREHLYDLLTTKPRDKKELVTKYLPSKLWRLNNLYYFIDKYGESRIFKMNRAQFVVYSKIFIHYRLIILKSRQQGISTLWLISFFDDALFYKNLNCGLMAQGKDEAATLLERLKHTWDHMNPEVLNFLKRRRTKDNTSEMSFNNGSTLFIRTSFRSATLHRLHISELGKIANKFPEKAKETKTGTLQTLAPGNLGVIESTAEGANMFKNMWDSSQKQLGVSNVTGKDFYPVFLSWLDDPDCVEFTDQVRSPEALEYFSRLEAETGRSLTPEQMNFWIMQERELEGDIHQEYPATPEEAFAAAKDGTYWARTYIRYVLRRRQRLPNLYDRALDVYCAMDLGRNDYNVLGFFQVWREMSGRLTIRIIGEYYNCGEDLTHYADYLLGKPIESGKLIDPDWYIKEVALPHDGEVTELTSRNKTREEILNDAGITNTMILEKLGVSTGIEGVRRQMPHIYIDESCTYLNDCLLYFTKEWNPVLNVWKNEPKRDEWKHGADMIRYMVQYINAFLDGEDNYNSDSDVVDGVSV